LFDYPLYKLRGLSGVVFRACITSFLRRKMMFAPNSSLGEKIKGAYMPSWVLLSMTAVEERVRKRTTKL
jgi:hypothetical protein